MSFKTHSRDVLAHARRFHAPSSFTDEAIHSFLSDLDCPFSLQVWLLYKNREFDQLANLDIDPAVYNSAAGFRDAYLAWSFLSKASFLEIAVSKKDAAFKKFFQYENLCKLTNSRFSDLSLDPLYQGSNVWLLNAVTRKIDRILGEFSAEEMFECANWGPGVTTNLKGNHVSAVNKFQCETGITRGLYSLVGQCFPLAYPRWHEHLTTLTGNERWFDLQVGNSIVTVPKNSKTDRVIAVEPGLNLWFQKGVGSMIRRRLLREGIDLTDQSRNQKLAYTASRHGILATVDFSSASDSIALKLVEELIPPRWFQLMRACRSPFGTHEGKLIQWEKFSSMGNGFTFELESLIFYAAAQAVQELLEHQKVPNVSGTISVYGDDVILPVACYELFSSFSAFLGFKVNPDKSFSSGYFRESCGSHYFDGYDVKPIFLKEKLQNVQSVYKLANSVRMLAHRRNARYGCDSRLRRTWRHLFLGVPKSLRLRTSLGLGDGGFVSNFDESAPSVSSAGHGIEGFLTTSLIEVGCKSDHFEGDGLLLARLKASSQLAQGNTYTLRGRSKTRVARVLVNRWYNLGPWI